MKTMLPTAALDQLKFDLADAAALAAKGDVAGGRQLLTTGLRRAETARDAGQPWGDELVRRYQAGISDYAARHGETGGEGKR
jgi:hypothetical protein